jgi:HPt (histidine-containing phosphotransfer) domain-containing protein
MDDNLINPEDWENFKSMAEPPVLAELLDVYLSDAPGLIEQMRRALAGGDVAQVQRAAHSLKSNSASLGATRLAHASRELEMLARSGTLEGGALQLAVIEAEYAQVAPWLEKCKDEFQLA